MEWREVTSDDALFKFINMGDFVEGKLKSTSISSLNTKIYHVERSDGSKVAFYGSAVINTKMSNVAVGDYFKLEYIGDKRSQEGKPYKNYKLYVPTDDAEDVV